MPTKYSAEESYTLGTKLAVDGKYEESAIYLKSAAERKFLPAQWDYALFLYRMGPKDLQDPLEAYGWFSVVYARDPISYKYAEKHLKNLEMSFSDVELMESKAIAEKYIGEYSL